MIALRSSGAGVTDGAREAHYGDNRFVPSAYDQRRFLRARRRRGARFVAYRVAQIVAAVDRFLFEDRPARERFLTAVAIGLSASVLVIMFSAALRGAVGHHG